MLYVLGFIAIAWFVYEFGASILWGIMGVLFFVALFKFIKATVSIGRYDRELMDKIKNADKIKCERDSLVEDCDKLTEELSTAKLECDALESQLIDCEDYKKQLEDLEQSNEDYKKQLESSHEDYFTVSNKYTDSLNELLKVIDEKAVLWDKIEEYEKRINELEEQNEEYYERLVNIPNDSIKSLNIEMYRAIIQSYKEELMILKGYNNGLVYATNKKVEGYTTENSKLRVCIFGMQMAIDNLKMQLVSAQTANIGVYTDIKKLVSIYKIIIYELERRLSEYDEDKKYKDMYISSNTEREQLEVQLEDCMLQVQEMQEQYNTLSGTMCDQSNTIKDLEVSIKERDTTIEDLAKTIESLNMELKLLKKWR